MNIIGFLLLLQEGVVEHEEAVVLLVEVVEAEEIATLSVAVIRPSRNVTSVAIWVISLGSAPKVEPTSASTVER